MKAAVISNSSLHFLHRNQKKSGQGQLTNIARPPSNSGMRNIIPTFRSVLRNAGMPYAVPQQTLRRSTDTLQFRVRFQP